MYCVYHPREETAWLSDLPFTVALPAYNALVVHAGLVPGKRTHIYT
jgi:hypothetical protein